MSLVLIVAAGLFLRTFSSLAHARSGFRQPVRSWSQTWNCRAHRSNPPDGPSCSGACGRRRPPSLACRARRCPTLTPLGNNTWNNLIELPDGPALPAAERLTYFNMVSVGWFQTYGTPLLAGRDFSSTDTPDTTRVAIVNEAFARRFTGGRSPLGTRVRAQGANRLIVGYVRDAIYESVRAAAPPTLYLPYGQETTVSTTTSISVRAAGGSPALLTKPLAAALSQVHGDIRITFTAPGRPGGCRAYAGACRRRTLGIFRRARAAAGGPRSVRRHLIRGEPASDRDRDPRRARRRARRRRPARPAARGAARGPRDCHWSGGQPVGVAVRIASPLRIAAAGSGRRSPRRSSCSRLSACWPAGCRRAALPASIRRECCARASYFAGGSGDQEDLSPNQNNS